MEEDTQEPSAPEGAPSAPSVEPPAAEAVAEHAAGGEDRPRLVGNLIQISGQVLRQLQRAGTRRSDVDEPECGCLEPGCRRQHGHGAILSHSHRTPVLLQARPEAPPDLPDLGFEVGFEHRRREMRVIQHMPCTMSRRHRVDARETTAGCHPVDGERRWLSSAVARRPRHSDRPSPVAYAPDARSSRAWPHPHFVHGSRRESGDARMRKPGACRWPRAPAAR